MSSMESKNGVRDNDEMMPVDRIPEPSTNNRCEAHALATTSCGNEDNNQRSTSQPTSINIREDNDSQNRNNDKNRTNTSKSSSRDIRDGNNEIQAVTKVDAMNTDENDVNVSMAEEDDSNLKVSDHHTTSDHETSQMSNQSSDQAGLSPMLSGDNEDEEISGEEPAEVSYTPVGNKFQCDLCAGILAASSRAHHTLTHTGEKPYKCNICDNSFAVRSALKSHGRTHTGEKPYKCEICGECFTQSSTLKSHNRIHTGETPFECEVCEESFMRSTEKNRHMNEVHSIKKERFRCEICYKEYTRDDSCLRHIHNNHKDIPYKDAKNYVAKLR